MNRTCSVEAIGLRLGLGRPGYKAQSHGLRFLAEVRDGRSVTEVAEAEPLASAALADVPTRLSRRSLLLVDPSAGG